MHPILTVVTLVGVEIPIGSYGVALCVALAVGSALSLGTAHRAGLDLGACIAALALATAGGFAGAAFLHAAAQFARTGSLHYALSHVGIAYFGAVLGGVGVLALVARLLRLDVLRWLDLSVPAIAAAHAIGRVGCVLGGCCHGRVWDGPFALRHALPLAGAHEALPRHPVALVEALFLAVLAVVFARARGRAAGSGRPLAAYFALYAAFRIAIEPLRADDLRGVFLDGLLSTSQFVGAGILAVCLAWLVVGTHASCPVDAAGRSSPSLPASSRPRRSSSSPTWRWPSLRARFR